jgi:hypothetical protein
MKLNRQVVEDVPHDHRVQNDGHAVEQHEESAHLVMDDEKAVFGTEDVLVFNSVGAQKVKQQVKDDGQKVVNANGVDLLHQAIFMVQTLQTKNAQ